MLLKVTGTTSRPGVLQNGRDMESEIVNQWIFETIHVCWFGRSRSARCMSFPLPLQCPEDCIDSQIVNGVRIFVSTLCRAFLMECWTSIELLYPIISLEDGCCPLCSQTGSGRILHHSCNLGLGRALHHVQQRAVARCTQRWRREYTVWKITWIFPMFRVSTHTIIEVRSQSCSLVFLFRSSETQERSIQKDVVLWPQAQHAHSQEAHRRWGMGGLVSGKSGSLRTYPFHRIYRRWFSFFPRWDMLVV